jgi:coenzyme F420-reducing hydrogenase alpha subunit
MGKVRTIKVDALARVEGEGALTVKVRDGKVEDCLLRIFEPPRFFEAFLRGRGLAEAPDITARICGICPVAYQMSAVHALESALGVRPSPAVRELRRLLYCGEWIESHVLHVAMLHAPDFLGYEDAIRMAKDHGPRVQDALALKKAGNEIVRVVGGREIHPVNVKVGGFYRFPTRSELAALGETLKKARGKAEDLLRWVAGFEFPDFEGDYELVSLRHPSEYPMNEGRIVSSRGLDLDAAGFGGQVEEIHVPHSNALQAVLKGRGAYFVGPLARYALNRDRLPAPILEASRASGLEGPVRNPFRSIVVRALEVLYAVDEALRVVGDVDLSGDSAAAWSPREAEGSAATEAPRGLLLHRYRVDASGSIAEARIVPPTSQNQKTIEDDLRRFVQGHLKLTHEKLTWRCEQAVRNYDPCISCATHFLKLTVDDVS